MQNVAWPRTIVAVEKPIPEVRTVAFRASPVTIPGRAIGSTSEREKTSRPKKLNRWIAKAASDPRRMAIAADSRPTWIDSARASRTDGLSQAEANHWVLNSRIGQTWIRSALNAKRAMIRVGK